MRNTAAIVLSAIVLLAQALLAHAEGGGVVASPAVGAASPAPPAAGSDAGKPMPPKPALNGNSALGTTGSADNQGSAPVVSGTDTSTAAPGGQAESSKNGALSSPPNVASPADGGHLAHMSKNPANKAGEETPK